MSMDMVMYEALRNLADITSARMLQLQQMLGRADLPYGERRLIEQHRCDLTIVYNHLSCHMTQMGHPPPKEAQGEIDSLRALVKGLYAPACAELGPACEDIGKDCPDVLERALNL
jgi:hypothetical protein